MGAVGKFQRAIRTGALALGLVGAMTLGSSASAGVLNGHAAAFNDGLVAGIAIGFAIQLGVWLIVVVCKRE